MAIRGNITIKGIQVENAYIKVRIKSISEITQPEPKSFTINYDYECRKDASTEEAFFSWSDAKPNADIDSNLFSQAYLDLAEKLSIPNSEV